MKKLENNLSPLKEKNRLLQKNNQEQTRNRCERMIVAKMSVRKVMKSIVSGFGWMVTRIGTVISD